MYRTSSSPLSPNPFNPIQENYPPTQIRVGVTMPLRIYIEGGWKTVLLGQGLEIIIIGLERDVFKLCNCN